MAVDMSSPIFDSTFGTGRFRYEEATKSPEPQDVRQALELQLFDLVELARDTRSDKGGEAKWVHPCGALVKEFAKRIAALAQSDAGPPPLRYSDKAERAGDGTETRRLELAQSNAEPVAWEYKTADGWGLAKAAAGLIEAAELAEARADAMLAGSRGGLGSMFADQSATDLREFAKFLRSRAADRSGK